MFFLISKFNVLLLITLANAITVELPCMTNEKHECLPNYILTDELYTSLLHSKANPYYSKRIENVVIHQDSKEYGQINKMNSPNTAYIIEVDTEYSEKNPEKYLKYGNKCPIMNEPKKLLDQGDKNPIINEPSSSSDHQADINLTENIDHENAEKKATSGSDDQNEIHLTMNNQEFIELRRELDSGDENSLNVKRLQLLPEIKDTNLTYWERIQPYVFTSIVKLFEEYDVEIKANATHTNNEDIESTATKIKEQNTKKIFLAYALSVVEHISKQLKKEEIYTQLFDYLIKIGMEPSEDDLQIQWNSLRYMSGDKGDNWLREIRAYDPLQFEPYWSYMLRCYKRNKSPIPRNIISLYLEWSLVDEYAELPIKYSTLLLRLLFTHPANILPIVNFKDTETTKGPDNQLSH